MSKFSNDSTAIRKEILTQEELVKLNPTAKELIGEKGQSSELVFKLPSWNGAVKSIRSWAKLAGINKKITWHSARHTLGNMLVNDFNTNIRVVQEVFGHSSLKPTMRYTKIRNDVKDKAVDQLPEMKLLLKPDQDKE